LKAEPLFCSDAALSNMLHFSKLVGAYEHTGCGNWFINLSPPSKILGSEMRLPTGPGSKAKKKKPGKKIVSNERHFRHRDWQLPLPPNLGVLVLPSKQADEEKWRVDKFTGDQPQSIHFWAHAPCTALLRTALKRQRAGSQAQLAVAYLVRMRMEFERAHPPAMMPHVADSCCEHYVKEEACGARRVHPAAQDTRRTGSDLDVKVVMPGEAGKQLFEEYPLSDQSVVARAHGRDGGKAGSAKGVTKTGKSAKGAAHWRAGVMTNEQDLLLTFQQEFGLALE
jgi:hypothetical protein